MTSVRLVLGDQLNPQHHWYQTVDDHVTYLLMEVREETDYVVHHAQKIIAIFAAMRDFAARLLAAGHQVHYLKISDTSNQQSLTKNILQLCREHNATCFEYQAPDEWRVDRTLKNLCTTLQIPTHCIDTEHFLTTRDDASRIFSGRRQWLMEYFYRQMRIRYNVLMESNGKPIGVQWNFDKENRQAWSGTPAEPIDWRSTHNHAALWAEIQHAGVKSFGEGHETDFRWPLNRAEALNHLNAFIKDALPHFGAFQDALNTEASRLFHSLLSFALNTKMIHPQEVIEKTVHAYQTGQAPLAAAEGFIRQILGWREYIRGVYWASMPGYADKNYFAHERPLPEWFWTGNTKMRCVAHAISQSLDTAYAHHIQRLMIIGNFSLLAGLKPDAVHQWYLGVYIDAFDWVERPNTLGMSQFADGGQLATKPYVSSASYIDKMSNYCKGCHYDKKDRLGSRACPFNALYWDFFVRHQKKLSGNPRLGIVFQQLTKMSDEQKDQIRIKAASLMSSIEEL
ncbi:MAG: cryptochrome/photolyase family protein [Fluviibacter sp.]